MNVWETLEAALRSRPGHTAVVDGDVRLTWSELARRARALAVHLSSRGVARSDRVAVLGLNSLEFLETSFAVCGLGAVLVPLNVRLAPGELAAVLRASGARLLVVLDSMGPLASRVTRAATPVEELLASGDPYDEAVRGDDGFEAAELDGDALAQLYFTSGTTGRPKGVMLTHGNLTAHARGAIEELGLGPDDVWGHVAPMFHLADAWANVAVTRVGGTHVMVPEFDPERVLDALQNEGVTLTNLIPTMLQRLVQHPGAGERRYERLRMLLSGGAPIAPAVVKKVIETFRCEYVQTYGLTETSPFLTLSLLEAHLRRLPEAEQFGYRARTGRPFRAVEVEVTGDDGRPVARDDRSVGEIRARGATVTPGYWNDPEATRRAFDGDWLLTGDLATVDAQGYLQIVDRKKDMIITGGEKVYCTEVEHVLYAHPDVLEAAVYGVPDQEWGERVCAAIVLTPASTTGPNELRAHCRRHLGGFKLPREIVIMEELPKTGSGKILKRALRQRAARLEREA